MRGFDRRTGALMVSSVFAVTASCDTVTPPEVVGDVDLNDEVIFADPILEDRVRQILEVSAGPVTIADMQGLVQLAWSGGEINDLSGLQHAANLERLLLPGSEVRDLEPLSGLPNLSQIDLSGNGLTDLSSLSTLTGLEYVDLDGNAVSDLTPLE